MKKEFDLEFCFKGNREYVHGTDIFTKLTEKYNNDLKKIDYNEAKISLRSLDKNTIQEVTSLPERTENRIEYQEQKRQQRPHAQVEK